MCFVFSTLCPTLRDTAQTSVQTWYCIIATKAWTLELITLISLNESCSHCSLEPNLALPFKEKYLSPVMRTKISVHMSFPSRFQSPSSPSQWQEIHRRVQKILHTHATPRKLSFVSIS